MNQYEPHLLKRYEHPEDCHQLHENNRHDNRQKLGQRLAVEGDGELYLPLVIGWLRLALCVINLKLEGGISVVFKKVKI